LEHESDKCIDSQVVTVSNTQETKPSAQAKISIDQVKQIVLEKVLAAVLLINRHHLRASPY
jgi:hypothetical protein